MSASSPFIGWLSTGFGTGARIASAPAGVLGAAGKPRSVRQPRFAGVTAVFAAVRAPADGSHFAAECDHGVGDFRVAELVDNEIDRVAGRDR